MTLLTVRQAQLETLSQVRRDAFVTELVQHAKEHFPAEHRVLGEAQVRKVVGLGVSRAAAHGLRTEGEVWRYVTLMFLLGSHFDRDPQLPWAAKALATPRKPNGRWILGLCERALEYVDRIAGPDGRLYTRALVRGRRLPFTALSGDLDALLQTLSPEKFEAVGGDARAALLALAKRKAETSGLSSQEGVALTALHMFLLGSHYDEDPLHPWAASVLAERLEPDAKARALLARAHQTFDAYFERSE